MNTIKIYAILLFYVVVFPCAVYCQENGIQKAGVERKAAHVIKNFYKEYATNVLSGTSNDSLLRKFLTGNLIEKVERMITATGADPVIRAQDFREDVVKTINVTHLDKNWYMVGYDWLVGGKSNHTAIPVRITKNGGHYMIDYITPEWNGALYGDSLLYDHPAKQKIDTSSPMLLLKTFYAAYVTAYCSMPSNLNSQLAAMRSEYLTSNALAQFKESENEYNMDGQKNYDLLIDDFDFDRLWIPSIKFTRMDDGTYQMCYMKKEIPCIIKLKIIIQGKEYRIDSIIK